MMIFYRGDINKVLCDDPAAQCQVVVWDLVE